MKSFAYHLRGLLSIPLFLFGAFMTFLGVYGLIYGEFHGPANSIFNLVIGIVVALGGWKLFPPKQVHSQH